MGWLKELTQQADPPVRSFGELARLALHHPTWPADVEIQPRSLAALLSRLDRELELEWLSNRPACQQALAAVLTCSVTDLQSAAWPGQVSASDATRRIRLRDVPFARALDLLEDSLPPGVPETVGKPDGWGRLFWQAPAGSGRSLAGRWLAARGLVPFSEDPAARPGPTRRGFLELPDTFRGPLPDAWVRDGVCITGLRVPPGLVERHGFSVVHTPRPDEFALELIEWLTQRLPPDSALAPPQVAAWLSHSGLYDAQHGAFGTILGVCGVLDELGLKHPGSDTPLQLATRLAKTRLAQATERGSRDGSWLARQFEEVWVGMAREALTESGGPLSVPRELEQWYGLVPMEFHGRVDAEWLKLSLVNTDSTLRARDVERAARRIPPGAFGIVRALCDARLLWQRSDGRFVVEPAFIARAAERGAIRRLLSGPALGWGDALLGEESYAEMLRACCDRAVKTGEIQQEVTELDGPEDPGLVAALEAEVRAAGLALLRGQSLDAEALAALFEEQSRLWLTGPSGIPKPRLGYPDDAGAPTREGWFHLALLAISEVVASERGPRRLLAVGPCNPWHGDLQLDLTTTLDSIADALGSPFADETLHAAALALIHRLPRGMSPTTHRLRDAGRVLHDIQENRATWRALCELHPDDATRLVPLGRHQKVLATVISERVIAAWRTAGRPDIAHTPLDPEHEPGKALFSHAPPSHIVELCSAALQSGRAIPWRQLPADSFRALGASLDALPEALTSEFWREVPEDVATLLLDGDATPSPQGAEAAWRRFAPKIERALRTWLSTHPDAAIGFMRRAPRQELPRVLAVLERSLELESFPDEAVEPILELLHDAIGARVPELRRAYVLLSRIEARRSPSR